MNKNSLSILALLKSNLIFIIILTIVCGAGYGLYTYKKEVPVYVASKQVILSADLDPETIKSSSSSALNNATLANMLLPTIASNLKSSKVVNLISSEYIAEKGEKATPINNNAIDVNYTKDGLIFSILYSSLSKDDAMEKLDYIITNFYDVFTKFEEMDEKLIPAGEVNLIPVQNDAVISTSSSVGSKTATGAAIGLLLAIAIVVLRYLLDNKVKTEQDIIDITGEGVLAYLVK